MSKTRLSVDHLEVSSFETVAVDSIDVGGSMGCPEPTPMTWCRNCPPSETIDTTTG